MLARLAIGRQLTCGSGLAHLTEQVVAIWLHGYRVGDYERER